MLNWMGAQVAVDPGGGVGRTTDGFSKRGKCEQVSRVVH